MLTKMNYEKKICIYLRKATCNSDEVYSSKLCFALAKHSSDEDLFRILATGSTAAA